MAKSNRQNEVFRDLLKRPENKYCADCKVNDHPRWASWSLGVFLCIRCSGIHRSMGTHISRVKSVDLDSWTDEQIDNMLKWGNERANEYWEAKLSPGHTPPDAKIENFVRTKYQSKRWVSHSHKPDPNSIKKDATIDLLANGVAETDSQQPPSSNTRQPPARLLTGRNAALPDASKTSSAPESSPTISFKTSELIAPSGSASSSGSNPSIQLLSASFLANKHQPSTATGVSQPKNVDPNLKKSILSLYGSNPSSKASSVKSEPSSIKSVPARETLSMSVPPSNDFDIKQAFATLNFGNPLSASTVAPATSFATEPLFTEKSTTSVPSFAKPSIPSIPKPNNTQVPASTPAPVDLFEQNVWTTADTSQPTSAPIRSTMSNDLNSINETSSSIKLTTDFTSVVKPPKPAIDPIFSSPWNDDVDDNTAQYTQPTPSAAPVSFVPTTAPISSAPTTKSYSLNYNDSNFDSLDSTDVWK